MIAHNLVSILDVESQDYKNVMASTKFDLGEHDALNALRSASSKTFLEIPSPISLFQIGFNGDYQMYLARQDDGGTIWRGWIFGRGQWERCNYEVFLPSKASFELEVRRIDGAAISGPNDIEPHAHKFALSCVAVANTVEVFSCCNVALVDHPPPKFINAKRIAKGKVPFFSYRTLHIIAGEKAAKPTGASASHASPRLHLRRGHIRRLGERRIWVSASLVGDKSKGFADKEYSVQPLA